MKKESPPIHYINGKVNQSAKVEQVDFDELRLSVKKDRAIEIFHDMEKLFDSTVGQLKDTMQRDRENSEKIFQKILSQSKE